MKRVLYTLLFVLYLSIASYAQGLGIANALTNVNADYAYGTNIALYGTFDVGGSSYSGSAWEVLNHRVITDYTGNTSTLYNKILYASGGQFNIILYSTINTSTLFPDVYAFYDYFNNADPKNVTIKVQKFDGTNWNTYKSVSITNRLVDPAPKVNASTNIITGLIYSPAGVYIGFHDGTTSSPIYTGAAIDANRNYFVPYVSGALYAASFTCGSGFYPNPWILSSSGNVPGADIYLNQYLPSGFEAVEQLNFRVPANANGKTLRFGITSACGGAYSAGTTDTAISMGSWY